MDGNGTPRRIEWAQSRSPTATIAAINSKRRKVTLSDADGKKRTVSVKSEVDLSRLAVGDSVDAVLTESVAINVTK